ncbi:DUF488 domain-containing protein [Neobacillus sp. SM06]|uniref:DUF488 domain-containing protein n=1 Tax=Neobacillus sp. SM06 TaxID=3422492 RepID=UPI003D2CBD41
MDNLFLKRIYEPYDEADGFRILVDRLWPRGMAKADAKLDLWLKDIAPSSELRKWFCHKPDRFAEFREKYLEELRSDPEKMAAVETVQERAKNQPVTLLYGAKDPVYNHAIVLYKMIKGAL